MVSSTGEDALSFASKTGNQKIVELLKKRTEEYASRRKNKSIVLEGSLLKQVDDPSSLGTDLHRIVQESIELDTLYYKRPNSITMEAGQTFKKRMLWPSSTLVKEKLSCRVIF